jgi:hypothetical protein
VPAKLLLEWAQKSMPLPGRDFVYRPRGANGAALKPISYEELDINQPWEHFGIDHPLTIRGIEKFVADYKSTLRRAAYLLSVQIALRSTRAHHFFCICPGRCFSRCSLSCPFASLL